jgi:hypothetical protein
MARRKHREERRNILVNRLEWIAFAACIGGGAFLVWMFAVVTP